MNVDNFNNSVSEIIKELSGKVGVINEKDFEGVKDFIEESRTFLHKSLDEVINLFIEQRLVAIDSEQYCRFIASIFPIYMNDIVSFKGKLSPTEAEAATIAIISRMSIDDMRTLLAQDESENTKELYQTIRVKYDTYSDGIVKDAFKTLYLKKLTGEN